MGVDLAGWRSLAASVAGTSHRDAGQPCADAGAVRVLRSKAGGSLLVAVASDGAGSAERGADGARLACETILEQADSRAGAGSPSLGLPAFGRQDVVLWVEGVRRRIAEAARSQSLESRDYSCTLLVALVDEGSAVFFQIGDGAIVYRGPGGAYVPALWPQSGEYANCTWFVTDEDAADRVQSAVAEGVHELALFTDGLQALALRFGSREAHGPFFEPMFSRLRGEAEPERLLGELRAFLESPQVNQRTDDDKTLVLATRLAAAAIGATAEP
ncbi:MAG TPA: PP2C family serine/threonine-protein phosphatase [Vicinamibacteria bacterium]|nr:PP2C family serine/threonine-protein phosphatase [Vicinamibacteria bacterium]